MTEGEAYYRDVLLQLQAEFEETVAAYEQQVSCLQEHNALLVSRHEQQERYIEELQARCVATENLCERLREQTAMGVAESESRSVETTARLDHVQHERDALKILLHQEQSYWKDYQRLKEEEMRGLADQMEDVQRMLDEKEAYCNRLHHEVNTLHSRVEAAVETSRGFEQRLKQFKEKKQAECEELERQIRRYRRKLHDKMEQNKCLTEALMEKEASRSESTTVSMGERNQEFKSSWTQRKTSDRAKQEDEGKRGRYAADASTDKPVSLKHRHSGHVDDDISHAPTSPTSSSPDWTPPITPEKRWSIGAFGREVPSQERDRRTSRQDPQSSSSNATPDSKTRLDRELSGLRAKLAACMQFEDDQS